MICVPHPTLIIGIMLHTVNGCRDVVTWPLSSAVELFIFFKKGPAWSMMSSRVKLSYDTHSVETQTHNYIIIGPQLK